MDKNIRVLSIPDIHYGKKNNRKLKEELEEIFWKFISNPDEHLDMISITGDLFDRPLQLNEYAGSEVVKFINRLASFTYDKGIELRLIKGTLSHDHNQLRVFNDLPLRYSNMKIVEHVSEEVIELNGKEMKILYIPEEYPSDYKEFYQEFLHDKPNDYYDMILGHGMIDFVAFTNYEEDGENRVHGTPTHKANDLIRVTKGPILFGHIHDLKEHRNQIFYSGSFTRYAFDSQEDKGFLVADIDKEDTSKFEMEFIENHLAPTYGVIDVDDLDIEDLDEKLMIIQTMKESYDYVKIKTSNEADLDIIRKLSEGDEDVQIQSSNKRKEANKVDEKYEFILERKLSLPDTIQRFINIEYAKDIPVEIINEIITDTETQIETIVRMKHENSKIRKTTVD